MAAATYYLHLRLALLRTDPAGLAMACQAAVELLVQRIGAAG